MVQVVGAAPMPTAARQRRGVLAPVVGLVLLGMCGLVVIGLVGGSIGAGGVVVGTLCALLPVGPVVATFLWVDRWEPEPPRMLLGAFLWGAGVAALSALLINSTAAEIIDGLAGRGSGDLLGATVVAPIVEEAVKGAFVVGLLFLRRREFDGIVDGIVYAGLVAAGFAFTENILYLGRAFAEDVMAGASGGVLTVLFLRGVLSPFAHPLFTSMIGIGVGIAAGTKNVGVRVAAILGGYVLAVVLHAVWNGSASFGGGLAFFGVYAGLMVPLFIAMIGVVVWQRRREQQTVRDQLPALAQAGWIAPSEVELLGSLAGRSGWRRAVQQRSGKGAAKAVGDYQQSVTELAFLRSRMGRGAVGDSGIYWHHELVAAVAEARARAVGNPDALTAAWRVPPPPGWAPPPPGWAPPGGPQSGWAAPGPGPGGPRPPAPGYGPPRGAPPGAGYGSPGPPSAGGQRTPGGPPPNSDTAMYPPPGDVPPDHIPGRRPPQH